MTTELAGPDGELATLLDLFTSSTTVVERPENATYLASLPSIPLPDLLATPTSLSTQSHTLTASLNALAHTSYPTILSLHNTSSALLTSLSSLDTSLNTLLDKALPALDDVSRTFREKSGPSVIEERQRTRIVLEQYDKLRDLLDVPVLIDTCVRNGLYAEALALAGHATSALTTLSTIRSQGTEGRGDADSMGSESESRLGSAGVSPLQLVSSLQAEIAASLHSMRLLLLNTLHEPGRKLPAFFKAVQFLRRMQVMPESELALSFVSARVECLQNALQTVERDAGVSVTTSSDEDERISGSSTTDREKEMDRQAEDVARFLKKYTDVWREGAYDLVTQYTTMFLERSQPHGPPSSSPLPDPVIKHTLPSTLLGLLLPTVKTYLRRAYPHLGPLATQLAYCSSAMARIGMDFRTLLSPLITNAVVYGFARDLRLAAEHEWSTTLSKHAPSSSTIKTTPPSKWLQSPSQALPTLSSLGLSPSSAAHVPPQQLTAFPPLALNLNAHLRALNRLRGLAPMGALRGVRDTLEATLARGGEALMGYARGWRVEGDEGAVVRAVGAAYVRVFVPFLRRAIVEGVFGVSDGSWKGGVDGEEGGGEGSTSSLSDVVRDWESWLAETEPSS